MRGYLTETCRKLIKTISYNLFYALKTTRFNQIAIAIHFVDISLETNFCSDHLLPTPLHKKQDEGVFLNF